MVYFFSVDNQLILTDQQTTEERTLLFMVFKIYYQENSDINPKREFTKSMFIEADNFSAARAKVEKTDFNIELIEELSKAGEEFERRSDSFEITKL